MFILESADKKLEDLSSLSKMINNGWFANITRSNEDPSPNKRAQEECGNDTFYGYTPYESVGTVSATFQGTGDGILSYGNCWYRGIVVVTLNGIEIGRSIPKSRENITFQYQKGDTLEIMELDTTIIQLHSLRLNENQIYQQSMNVSLSQKIGNNKL